MTSAEGPLKGPLPMAAEAAHPIHARAAPEGVQDVGGQEPAEAEEEEEQEEEDEEQYLEQAEDLERLKAGAVEALMAILSWTMTDGRRNRRWGPNPDPF